jgi:RimJ/RimL family protein N-acetyltransferase
MSHSHTHPSATARLVIREFVRQDKDFIYELLNTEDWLRFIGDRNIHSLKDAEYFITEKLSPSYRKNGFGFYAMLSKSHNKVIGMCGLVKREGLEHVDLGFAVLPKFLKNGFAYEASLSCIEYAKNSLKINTLAAICNTDNVASIALLNKLGFKFIRTIILPNETTLLNYYELVL